jgi:hypothetical protein
MSSVILKWHQKWGCDDDLVGIKTKHDGGLRGSYGHIGNGNAVGLDQNGLVFV